DESRSAGGAPIRIAVRTTCGSGWLNATSELSNLKQLSHSLPRVVLTGRHGSFVQRPSLRNTKPAKASRHYIDCHSHADVGHWREHGDLQPGAWRPLASTTLQRTGAFDRHPRKQGRRR